MLAARRPAFASVRELSGALLIWMIGSPLARQAGINGRGKKIDGLPVPARTPGVLEHDSGVYVELI